MYDKVKARSSQNQSLKGNQSNAVSSTSRSKSESDYGKNKSGHDSDSQSNSGSSSSSSSSSSSNEDGEILANKKVKRAKQQQDSDSSEDDLPFNQLSSKINKLNKLNRKRKIASSQSSSDSSSDSEKEEKEDHSLIKTSSKKKQMKKQQQQLNRSAFNWNSDSEDELAAVTSSSTAKQTPIKQKNASPSHSTTSKKNKFTNVFENKKSIDSLKDHQEQVIASNKKRSLQEDKSTDSIKHKDSDKLIKKKKLQKSSSDQLLDKENDLLKKEKKKLSSSKSNEQADDSDEMSAILSKVANSLKKKKKKKDKLEKLEKLDKDKSIKSLSKDKLSPKLMSPKTGFSSSNKLNKQQIKEDLEMSDSDIEMPVIKSREDKLNSSKSSKKELDTSSLSKKQHKIKKDEKPEKKLSASSKDDKTNKSIFSDSDSEIEQSTIKPSKKQKKNKADKDRKMSKESIKSKVSKVSSDSSDNESIVQKSSSKKNKDKIEKEHHKRTKEKSKHSELLSITTSKKSSSKHNESSISDLSIKQHYNSDKALTSDSESDNNLTSIKEKSSTSKNNNNTSERIFNTLANRNNKVFSSSEHSDEEEDNNLIIATSKNSNKNQNKFSLSNSMDTSNTNVFLSPNKHLSNSLIDNNATADLWLMQNTPKCDEWNDITKTAESFSKYLEKTNIASSTEWEESDDELLPKGSSSLISNPLLPNSSLSLSTTTSTVNHALESQIAKNLDSRPLTSSTGKEVLKAIKSPKKATDLHQHHHHLISGSLIDQTINKQKKKDSNKSKEDKCKENNEERKIKKNKKSKEQRDQIKHMIKEDKKLMLNNELSLFDSVKEIKSEPVIAAVATIHPTQLFGHNTLDSKSISQILHQPASPFSEKQAHQMNKRLLTDVNNSSNLFGGSDNTNNKQQSKQLHGSNLIKASEESQSKKLIKANEMMMFSISEESSNDDDFLPAIGVSFSSSSSNSSSNSNQNVPILSNLSSAGNKEKSNSSQDKQPVQRKYEEEAAIEAKRLEAELMKSKDLSSNWKSFKDPGKDLFLDLMVVNKNERLSTSSNSSNKSSSNLNLSANKPIISSHLHKKPQNKSIVLENATTIFNVITSGEVKDPFLDSDETQFKITDGKDELDDQRKMEDDLAVESLLQLEMLSNNKDDDTTSSSNKQLQPTAITTATVTKHISTITSSSGTTIGQRKLSNEHSSSKVQTTDLIHDDIEPNRLQIAEDIVNENSIDSDVFHSANDVLEAEAALAVSAITCQQQHHKSHDASIKTTTSLASQIKSPQNNNHNRLKSPLLSPTGNLLPNSVGLPTTIIIEPKPVPNIVEVSNNNNLFRNSDYGADENELTIDLNEDESDNHHHKKASSSIPSFMSTLEKLTTNKQRKTSTSSINLFDHLSKDAGQLEIEIPTSLADVKQAITNKNLISKNSDSIQQHYHQSLISPKHTPSSLIEKELLKSDASDQSTDALLQSPNSISLSSSHNKQQLSILADDESIDSNKNAAQEQRPKRGRRAKTRKSSESEDGLKISLSTPLSPTNQQLITSGSNISPNNNNNSSSLTSSSKAQATTRRSTRNLISSSDSNAQDDLLNENLSEDNQAHDDIHSALNTDGKRKRGRKKKGEQHFPQQQQQIKTTLDSTIASKLEANKNLSPYDVFEFNDSDEENSPTLPLMSLHGAIEHHKTQDLHQQKTIDHHTTSNLENSSINNDKMNKENITTIASTTTFFEQITPVTPLTQTPFSLTTNTSPTTATTTNQLLNQSQQSEQDKEYTTELSQHGKLSITIRLQQKDKDQSNSSPEHHLESDKLMNEDNQNSSNSNDLSSSSNNKPLTRKSARLMLQTNKTTIDEVIEDVVKGKHAH